MAGFPERVLRAALLDAETYEEVEADTKADGQAFAVVMLAALAAGIGSIENAGGLGLLTYTLATVGGWYIWAYSAYLIGTRLLPGSETKADQGELLRTIGFSAAPGMLRVNFVNSGAAPEREADVPRAACPGFRVDDEQAALFALNS